MPLLRIGTYEGAAPADDQREWDDEGWVYDGTEVDEDTGSLIVSDDATNGTALSPAMLPQNITGTYPLRAFRMIGLVEKGCAILGRVRSAPDVEDLPSDPTPLPSYPWTRWIDVFDDSGVARANLLEEAINNAVTQGLAMQVQLWLFKE